MIKGILIDLDNTLYEYNYSHQKAMEQVFNFTTIMGDIEKFKTAYNNARNKVHEELKNTASSHNRILYFQRTLENLNKNFFIAKPIYEIYWNSFLDNMKLYDGVTQFFESNKNKEICLVTDLTAYIQYCKIEKLGIAKYIKYLVTSEETGIEKPHRKIFETALQKLKLSADDVCMIGDSFEKDIIGALNLGIKPYWLSNVVCTDKRVTVFKSFHELEIE